MRTAELWSLESAPRRIMELCRPIEFQSQEKKFKSKKQFSKIWFLDREICFLEEKKVTNIQTVTHPYLGRLLKNMFEVFQKDIAD